MQTPIKTSSCSTLATAFLLSHPPLRPLPCPTQISYLSQLGVPNHNIENMAAISKAFLGRTLEELQGVVAHAESRGIEGVCGRVLGVWVIVLSC
jgi:hypothetical protein